MTKDRSTIDSYCFGDVEIQQFGGWRWKQAPDYEWEPCPVWLSALMDYTVKRRELLAMVAPVVTAGLPLPDQIQQVLFGGET